MDSLEQESTEVQKSETYLQFCIASSIPWRYGHQSSHVDIHLDNTDASVLQIWL